MFTYTPSFIPKSIIVIGAGGTGSRLAPPLIQLVKTSLRRNNPLAWIENLSVYFVDGDVVEDKNLARQNFIAQDVGKNKAAVIAERYSVAFGIDVYAVPKFWAPSAESTQDQAVRKYGRDNLIYFSSEAFPIYKEGVARMVSLIEILPYSIVVFAVDSAEARRTVIADIMSLPLSARETIFIVDAGNEDDFGQVKFFNPVIVVCPEAHKNRKMKLLKNFPVGVIPMNLPYYENLGTSAQELSCADLPQTLAINAVMGVFILSVIQNFLLVKPFSSDCFRFHLNGSMASDPNTVANWAERTAITSASPAWLRKYSATFAATWRGGEAAGTLWRTLSPSTPVGSQMEVAMEDNWYACKNMGMIAGEHGEFSMPKLVNKPQEKTPFPPSAPVADSTVPAKKGSKPKLKAKDPVNVESFVESLLTEPSNEVLPPLPPAQPRQHVVIDLPPPVTATT